MSSFAAKQLMGLSVAAVALALSVAGCGGAEARKAKHLEKGQAFLLAGNYEKARVEFRNALQIAPTDGEARFENGVLDEKLGNIREAAQFYQGAIDVNPENLQARVKLGRLYLFSGAPERAMEIIKPAFAKHPDDPGLLTVRAAARVQMKDPSEALADAQRAVQLAPDNEDAVAVLAGIEKSQDHPDQAETLLRDAIKRIPATAALRLTLAQLYASTGQEAAVEGLLTELVRLNPREKTHRLRLAQYYARLNRLDEAERVLREGVKDLPDERDLKVGLVDFLSTRRDRAVAEKALFGFIAESPKDYALRFELGSFYEQGKEAGKAEAVYREVIQTAGLDAPGITARNRLAALHVQGNDTAGAEKLIDEVLAKNPRDNDALILRGNIALAQKDPKTAIADLRSVLRDQPNAVAVMRSLARAHLLNGEPALAEDIMRRAVDANTQDPGARLDLAMLLIQLDKPAQAQPVIDELVRQQPANLEALDAQFKVARAAKDFAVAKSAADSMVAVQPKSALGYYYQGVLAEEAKRPTDALTLYQTALDLKPESAEPLEAITRLLVAAKRLPEALKRLDDVSARFPKVPIAPNLKGEVLLSSQHNAEAVAAFKTAIEREPKWWTPYRNLAVADYLSHDEAGAITTLQAGISTVTDRTPLEAELAGLYEKGGKTDQAMGVYEAELKRNAGSDVSANNLAMLLVTYRKDPASLDRAQQLAARFSNSQNPSFLDTYGWVLYKRGEGSAAVAALQGALQKTPDSPVSLYHLGMAQALAGQSTAARDTLSRSLQSGKSFTGMEEAKATLDSLAKLTPSSAPVPKT